MSRNKRITINEPTGGAVAHGVAVRAPAQPVAYHDKDQPNGIAWCPGYPEGLNDITPLYAGERASGKNLRGALAAGAPAVARHPDTARLDWLEEHGTFNFYKVLPEAADKNGSRWRWRHEREPGARSSAETKAMPSLRSALDAAADVKEATHVQA